MTKHLSGSVSPLVDIHDAALLDLDGVVYRGPLLVEHAADAIAAARAREVRVVFVTNNANRKPSAVAAHLVELGVPASAPDVATSAQAAAAILARELPLGSPVLAVGGPGLRAALVEVGFLLVGGAADRPLAVVQGYSPKVGWTDLAEAAYAIEAGAIHLATNLDASIPTDRGTAPGNGTLVAAVRSATGVEPASAGKPQPEIFLQAATRVGSTSPIVVGDRLDTDLAGAIAAGMPGLHVLTGVDGAREVVLAAPRERPTYVALDLRGLLVHHPEPRPAEGGWWRCRGAEARIGDGGLAELRRAGDSVVRLDAERVAITLDELRALACAAWEASDAGRPLAGLPELEVRAEGGEHG